MYMEIAAAEARPANVGKGHNEPATRKRFSILNRRASGRDGAQDRGYWMDLDWALQYVKEVERRQEAQERRWSVNGKLEGER